MKEYRGTWRLPSNPDIEMAGILKVDNENSNIELKLYSKLRPDGSEFDGDRSYRIEVSQLVLGAIHSIERQVTLFSYGGFFIENTIGIDVREYTFKADFAFFGVLFKTRDEIKFKKVSFQLSYLGRWFDLLTSGLIEHDHDKFGGFFIGSKSLSIPLTDSSEINILRTATAIDNQFDYSIKVEHIISVEFKNDVSFWDHTRIISRFSDFLYFAIGEPIDITNCSFSEAQRKIESSFWKSTIKERGTAHEMTFKAQNFSDEYLQARIRSWFEMYEKFSACISVFLHAVNPIWISGSRNLTHTQFTNSVLNIAQALEGFFRKDQDIDYEEIKADFLQKKASIVNKIKKKRENIGLTKEELQFINNNLAPKAKKGDYSLQGMILELCKSQKDALSDLIHPDLFDKFSKDLKDIRNTLSHINHDSDEEVNEGDQIYKVFNVSQALFYSLVMSKVGFTQKEIRGMLENLKGFM